MTLGPGNEYKLHFAAGPQARWRGASDEHAGLHVRSEQQSQRACGPQPDGARPELCSGSSTMTPHRLRRRALHLPARRSRQNATFIYFQALTSIFAGWGVQMPYPATFHLFPETVPASNADVHFVIELMNLASCLGGGRLPQGIQTQREKR